MNDEVVTHHETVDEAIAVAIEESKPGDVVEVHEQHCDAEQTECTCKPTVLVIGAEA